MTRQTRQEVARMACKAFAPRLVGSPCVYPDCACKGPSEVADYVLAGREALQGVVKAWDSLRMGDYPRDVVETWLADKMKPAIEKARGVLAPPVAEPKAAFPGDIVEIEVPARSSTSPDGIRYRGVLVAKGEGSERAAPAPSKNTVR